LTNPLAPPELRTPGGIIRVAIASNVSAARVLRKAGRAAITAGASDVQVMRIDCFESYKLPRPIVGGGLS